ncbi:hypothetical protein [Streptomyces sp. NPDC089919]|uniref:hypothetical protein n=1 Tax=Streptomyces sp. NPDC089919 TaxID=3155188 RepID=UPI00344741D0
MIATDQIRGPARRARLGRLTAYRARRRGRLDAPGLRPLLPAPPPGGGGVLELPDVHTPFVMETRAEAQRAVGQLRARLLRDRRAAIVQIHAESVRVVTQYDVRAEPSPAALARYGARVGAWRADAALCRARATALTHEANQRLACYWDAVWLTVQSARAEEARRALEAAERRRRPAAVRRDPTAPGSPGADPRRPRPAPPLVPRPEQWLPGRVSLDATWGDLDAWLLTGGTPATAPRTPAVARALEILDTQPDRARPAAAPGRGTR